MKATINRSIDIVKTPRLQQMLGIFDVPPAKKSELTWSVELPIEERDWNIGLIVGPSGCGKSTIAQELFGEHLCTGFEWPKDKSIVDAFPAGLSIKDITGLLSSVGFSSPPSWVRPFHVLSNGEQFRVTTARALAEAREMTVIDEFTSVIDRQVAQVGSAAVARAVRRHGKRLVAVGCHYDIIEWLDPDWIYQPATGEFSRRSERRRPEIELTIRRVHPSAWKLFGKHHYLSTDLAKAARCFVGFVGDQPAAFVAVMSFPHPTRPGFREHRCVCLPDFQGVGIGKALSEYVASLYACRKPYFSTTSSPAMIRHRAKSPLWDMKRGPSATRAHAGGKGRSSGAEGRYTSSFEYVGPKRWDEAKSFGVI